MSPIKALGKHSAYHSHLTTFTTKLSPAKADLWLLNSKRGYTTAVASVEFAFVPCKATIYVDIWKAYPVLSCLTYRVLTLVHFGLTRDMPQSELTIAIVVARTLSN